MIQRENTCTIRVVVFFVRLIKTLYLLTVHSLNSCYQISSPLLDCQVGMSPYSLQLGWSCLDLSKEVLHVDDFWVLHSFVLLFVATRTASNMCNIQRSYSWRWIGLTGSSLGLSATFGTSILSFETTHQTHFKRFTQSFIENTIYSVETCLLNVILTSRIKDRPSFDTLSLNWLINSEWVYHKNR